MKPTRPSRHPNLGRVVATIVRAADELENDPMNDYAGFTPDVLPALEALVREEEFANVAHFLAVVERRASPRWAHFHLPV